MNVILLKDVKNLGSEGDTVKVKDGFARNYLIPRKLATICNISAVKFLEAKKKKAAQKAEKEKNQARELAKKISKISLNIPMEAGVNENLFGSVTPEKVFHALREEGIGVDKRDIVIKEPIKKLGVYNVEVKLHPEVSEVLRIWVVKK